RHSRFAVKHVMNPLVKRSLFMSHSGFHHNADSQQSTAEPLEQCPAYPEWERMQKRFEFEAGIRSAVTPGISVGLPSSGMQQSSLLKIKTSSRSDICLIRTA